MAFSPDGLLAVGSADKTLRLWQVSDPAHPMALARPLRGPTSYVCWVNFHPSGSLITAASTDGTIWIWETDPQRAAETICSTMGEPITRAEWEQYLSSIPCHPPC